MQLYISRGHLCGGATRFIGSGTQDGVSCAPELGRALVFQHKILHEGELVREGTKYTIRTDVEYSGIPKGAQLQELIGLGGSPHEQRRRVLVSLPVVISFAVCVWLRYFSQ